MSWSGYGQGSAYQQQGAQPAYGQGTGYAVQRASAPPPHFQGAPSAQNNQYAPQQPSQQMQYGRPSAPPPNAQQLYGAPPAQHSQVPPAQRYGGPPGAPQGYPPSAYGQPPNAPPPGVSPDLWQWFQAVDQDRSGRITCVELQQALTNGNWTPFNSETCRLMIGMFDRDRNGTIDVHEFAALWKYIQDWKSCFERFDTDRSGNINASELGSAFQAFGYNLQKDSQQRGMITVQYEEFLRLVLETGA